ncbi:hypothetical protein ACLZHR_18770 [Priestia aryabhattai]|uniref:hypothetical protein n=1 Tax=Priestia TaxID=2800373 RepID=UPI002100ACD4|nr:hypothetical protein [Priestia megaterium]
MVLNNIQLTLLSWFNNVINQLENKYQRVIENKSLIWVIVLIAVVGGIAYAFYCTSRGYTFSGKFKLHWPKIWDIGIGCYPKK